MRESERRERVSDTCKENTKRETIIGRERERERERQNKRLRETNEKRERERKTE